MFNLSISIGEHMATAQYKAFFSIIDRSRSRSFELNVAAYYATRPLVIDPVLSYSTYLGGGGNDIGYAIAVDNAGNAYVTGLTRSTNFPGVGGGAIQPSLRGSDDVFVAKLNAAGSALVYSTYLGGTTYDAVNGIAVDAARNAYVVGYTDSSNFPTAVPLQASRNGAGNDAFVVKLNAAGSALVYGTYLGGSGGDVAYDVAVDSGGHAFVSGWTTSSNFPTAAPLQVSNTGSGDAFISQLNAAGSALVFSTYWGAQSGAEHGYGIALDGAGNIYLTGETSSANLTTTPGAFRTLARTFFQSSTRRPAPKVRMRR